MTRADLGFKPRTVVFLITASLLALHVLASSTSAYFSADFEQRYFADHDLLITDHTLYLHNGTFHLFYTVGIVGQGWPYPNNMRDFGHAVSTDLIHWSHLARVLNTVQNTWKDRNLWAPHVIADPQGGWLQYYCGVDSSMVQATGVARSVDLSRWTDMSMSLPAYHPDTTWALWAPYQWSNGRDPFAFRQGNGYGLLSTAMAKASWTGDIDRGAISLASSSDGINFVDAGFPMFLNDTPRVLESPSLYRRPERYFLFFHESGLPGIRYMTSTDLLGWDKSQTQIMDPVAFGPSEVVSTGNGTLMGSVRVADFAGTSLYGAKFDTLAWTETTVSFINENTLWDHWTAISGDAFLLQPAYGDRPFARGELPSGIEGFFWINTAETYTGPIHSNDPYAPPQLAQTGVLRSETFTITGGHIRFLIGGGHDYDHLYIELVNANTGTKYHRTTGSGSNVLEEVNWDLAGLQGIPCTIRIVDSSFTDFLAIDGIREEIGPPSTAVGEGAPELAISLGAAYPSPTRGAASIPFRLERAGQVRLGIYDVAGRLRKLVLERQLAAGDHATRWDGRDTHGAAVPAGIYYLRLENEGRKISRSLAIVP